MLVNVFSRQGAIIGLAMNMIAVVSLAQQYLGLHGEQSLPLASKQMPSCMQF